VRDLSQRLDTKSEHFSALGHAIFLGEHASARRRNHIGRLGHDVIVVDLAVKVFERVTRTAGPKVVDKRLGARGSRGEGVVEVVSLARGARIQQLNSAVGDIDKSTQMSVSEARRLKFDLELESHEVVVHLG